MKNGTLNSNKGFLACSQSFICSFYWYICHDDIEKTFIKLHLIFYVNLGHWAFGTWGLTGPSSVTVIIDYDFFVHQNYVPSDV